MSLHGGSNGSCFTRVNSLDYQTFSCTSIDFSNWMKFKQQKGLLNFHPPPLMGHVLTLPQPPTLHFWPYKFTAKVVQMEQEEATDLNKTISNKGHRFLSRVQFDDKDHHCFWSWRISCLYPVLSTCHSFTCVTSVATGRFNIFEHRFLICLPS